MSTTGTKYDNDMAKYYLARIYSALNGLLTAPPSLGLVQCLIGVATLITSTPCHYNMSEGHFVSTALRVIQGLTYCDEEETSSDTARDMEQERRVFWLAFIHDTGASVLTNSPTTHRQEDVISCVSGFTFNGLGAVTAAEGHWQVNIFALRVRLAVLQAEATDQVLSAKRSGNATPLDIDAAAAMVLTRLEQFHDHEVFQLDAGQLFKLLYRSDICHVVSLEASYFATVYRLQTFLALSRNSRINPFSLEGLKRVATLKQHRSYAGAQRLLSLLPIAPRGDVGLYWRIHRIIIAALVTIFAHHVNNPAYPPLQAAEMREYNQVLTDIGTMVQNDCHADLAQTQEFCVELFTKLSRPSNCILWKCSGLR
jgi:hypothetical protein